MYHVEKTQRGKESKQTVISEDLEYPPINLPQFIIGRNFGSKICHDKMLPPEGHQIQFLLQH